MSSDSEYSGVEHVYEVYDGETNFVVARNEDHALRILAWMAGYTPEEYCDHCDEIETRKCDADRILKVINYEDGKSVEKTCREWAEIEVGVFCSSAC